MDAGMKLITYYRLGDEYFKELSKRERLIASCVLLVATVMMPFEFYWLPMLEESSRLDKQAGTLVSQIKVLDRTHQELIRKQDQDPNEQLKVRNQQLKKQLANQESQLSGLVDSLVKPEDMPGLLQQVLKGQKGVTVRRFRNLPPKQIFTAGDLAGDLVANHEAADSSAEKNEINDHASLVGNIRPMYSKLYSHKVQVEFEAGFINTLHYLHHLESIQEGLLFERLEYKVAEHPRATVLLSVETIGFEEEWLGV